MRYIFTLSIFFVLLAFSCSQTKQLNQQTNLSTEKLFKENQFNWISEFSNGLALVYLDDQCYVINEKGEKQFDFPYMGDRLDFKHDYAIFTEGFYQGIIDKKGEIITAPKFLRINKGYPAFNRVKTKDFKNEFYDITTNQILKLDSISPYTVPLSNELLINQKDDKLGAIDKAGRLKIPYQYDQFLDFHDGTIITKQNGKYGLIDNNNNKLIPFLNDDMYRLNGNHNQFLVTIGVKSGIIDNKNEIILPIEYDYLREIEPGKYQFKKDNSSGVMDKNFNIISDPQKKTIHPYFNIFEKNGKLGIIDINGNTIQPPIYDDIKKINGFALLLIKDGKKNVLSSDGIVLLDKFYDQVYYDKGFIQIREGNKSGLKSLSGKTVLDIEYFNISVESGSLITQTDDSTYVLYDYNGNEILKPKYRRIEKYRNIILANGKDSCLILSQNFSLIYHDIGSISTTKQQDNDYLMILNKKNKKYLFDLLNNEIIIDGYFDLNEMSFFKNHFKIITPSAKVGIINNQGKLVLDTIFYEIESMFKAKEYIKVKSKNGVGIYNHKLKQIIPPVYKKIDEQTDFIVATKNNKKGVLDYKGNILVDFNYRRIKGKINSDFIVSKDKLYGLVDSSGQIKVDFKYQSINDYSYPIIQVKENNKYGLINVSTKQKSSIDYQSITYITDSIALVKKDNLYGLMKTSGELLVSTLCENITFKKQEKVIKNFRRSIKKSSKDDPLLHFIVKYKAFEFKLNPSLECIDNCPNDGVLGELNLK